MERLNKIELYFSRDAKDRNYVAGKAGSGKSTYLRGIAAKLNYLYLSKDEGPWFNKDSDLSCSELRKAYPNIVGMVIDCTRPHEIFNDWKHYNWDIPVWYAVQLKADGNLSIIDREQNAIINFPIGKEIIDGTAASDN